MICGDSSGCFGGTAGLDHLGSPSSDPLSRAGGKLPSEPLEGHSQRPLAWWALLAQD